VACGGPDYVSELRLYTEFERLCVCATEELPATPCPRLTPSNLCRLHAPPAPASAPDWPPTGPGPLRHHPRHQESWRIGACDLDGYQRINASPLVRRAMRSAYRWPINRLVPCLIHMDLDSVRAHGACRYHPGSQYCSSAVKLGGVSARGDGGRPKLAACPELAEA